MPPLGVASGSSTPNQLVRRLEAIGGPLREATHHHALERGRETWRLCAHADRRLRHVRRQGLLWIQPSGRAGKPVSIS